MKTNEKNARGGGGGGERGVGETRYFLGHFNTQYFNLYKEERGYPRLESVYLGNFSSLN